jgi:hypothetical protein
MYAIKLPFALAIAALSAHVYAGTPPLTGRFVGSGRACYGTLDIARETISWNTAFSRCKARPFHLTAEKSEGKQRLTFEFTETSSACRFQVVSLTHDETSGAYAGWEATGYADLASYREDKRSGYTRNGADMMSCALIRDPEPVPRRRVK